MLYKVLYIEDNKEDRLIFQRFYSNYTNKYKCSYCESLDQAKKALHTEIFDLVIINYQLKNGKVFDVLPFLKDSPFLVFSKKNNIENAIESRKKGAFDFIIKDSHGEYLQTLSYTIDNAIQRKKLDTDLKIHQKKFDELYLNRTSELKKEIEERKRTEKELIKAIEKAKESDNLKSTFLANVSHEIRTPLNAIVGFSQLLKDKNISQDEKNQYIDVISKNSEQLVTIINDIIDISKIEANQIDVKNTKCNIFNMFLELLIFYDSNKKFKKNKDIKLQVSKGIEKEKSYIITDEKRLYQVMNNLINNAYKFTTKGNITFGFKLVNRNEIPSKYTAKTKEERFILFFVEDTGEGIENEQKELVFKHFRQVNEQYTRTTGGTGLGLSISKALIERMGGNIWVESEVGKGSRFQFYLPYIVPEKNTTSPNQQEKHNNQNYNWHDKSFLIVEDEYSNFKFIEILLKKTHAKLERAEDGQQAVEMAGKNYYDLILMDIRLPIIDGYEATKQIRKFNKNIPIIAQTAYAMTGDRMKSIKAGCNDYIIKPIKKELLLNSINNLLISKLSNSTEG